MGTCTQPERETNMAICEYLNALDDNAEVELEDLVRKYPSAESELRAFVLNLSAVQAALGSVSTPFPNERHANDTAGDDHDTESTGVGREPSLRELETLWEFVSKNGNDSMADERFAPRDDHHSADPHPKLMLGRFEVVRLVGQGGCGMVWKAFDTALQRPVALKLPRLDVVASQANRLRFLREAQSVAMMEHPGIVPVYDSGGVGPLAYVVSAFCAGPSLANWKAENNPVPIRTAAELLRQLAVAVAHAHSRGILHRDLKPANVLLEPIQEESFETLPFQPKITDFGLAKSIGSDVDLTRTGDLVGTVQYMAPEQAAGDVRSISVQTDIHALGVMLYELLTGTLPSKAGSHFETLRSIQEDIPRSPNSLRRYVPRDLEAICLRCLAKRPESRYASALDLAADLRRFLAGEPVQAKPAGWPTRMFYYWRRRPLAAALAGVLAVTAVLGAVGAVRVFQRERQLRWEAQWKEQFARQAVDDMYTQVAENWLGTNPQGEQREQLRKEFLMKALHFYEQLGAEHTDDPNVRYEVSRAVNRAANIERYLGHPEKAVANRHRCLELLDGLLKQDPGNRDYRYDWFHTQMVLHIDLEHAGEIEQSDDVARTAYDAIELLVADYPEDPLYLDSLAAMGSQLALCLRRAERLEEADAVFARCADVASELFRRFPERTDYVRNIAKNTWGRAVIAQAVERFKLADLHYKDAIDFQQSFVDANPGNPGGRRSLADFKRSRSSLLILLKQQEKAEELLLQSLAIFDEVLEEFPMTADYRIARASVLYQLGDLYVQGGKTAAAEKHFAASFDFLYRSNELDPECLRYTRVLHDHLTACPLEEFSKQWRNKHSFHAL